METVQVQPVAEIRKKVKKILPKARFRFIINQNLRQGAVYVNGKPLSHENVTEDTAWLQAFSLVSKAFSTN